MFKNWNTLPLQRLVFNWAKNRKVIVFSFPLIPAGSLWHGSHHKWLQNECKPKYESRNLSGWRECLHYRCLPLQNGILATVFYSGNKLRRNGVALIVRTASKDNKEAFTHRQNAGDIIPVAHVDPVKQNVSQYGKSVSYGRGVW